MIEDETGLLMPPPRAAVTLPLARPKVVYLLLGLILFVFLIETMFGGSTRTAVLVALGAQVNLLVWRGEVWRLLTAMFLHIGVMHVMFNSWALYSLGRDVEMFFGSVRFTIIYFCSGLFGGVAYYLFGGPTTATTVSAGASGAVFGVIGAELAYWLRNREVFGSFGRQRLANLGTLVMINLVFGFTVPGINNLAHLGGLISGFLLALALAPYYQVTWRWAGLVPSPELLDRSSGPVRVAAVAAALALLLAGLALGDQRWTALAPFLRL
ncbi:MAG: rhomboid family intramembrane serine protease [Anaerolineae bacterium]